MSKARLLSEERLDEIGRRCAEATPGQWIAVIYDDLDHANREGLFRWARADRGTGRPAFFEGPVGTVLMHNCCEDGETCGWKDLRGIIEVAGPDARFIAHARADVPALLAEVLLLRDQLAARGVGENLLR